MIHHGGGEGGEMTNSRHFREPRSDFLEVEGGVDDSIISRVFRLGNRVIMKCLIV